MIHEDLHSWHLTPTEAVALQRCLAARVVREGEAAAVCVVGGADVSVGMDRMSARAAVVTMSYPALELIQVAIAEGKLDFPYIPGLLSFREARLILQAWEQLTHAPDLLLVDGHGIAHPRRLGIASHLGLWLQVPTIGCAKSRLCGDYLEPGPLSGDAQPLYDRGELVGMVLRTKRRTRPLFVSVGHRLDLENAVAWVLKCLRGYRLPEPVRLAHLASNQRLP
ncbi:MAG: deoxyribonuclease V [Dehalococcoidia bacterium]|nr:deoxyribonuclease V [Dehalococcoidia bacterium]